MSASRERKQRQIPEEQTLSPKELEELQKAADGKRKAILYTVIGVVAAILVAALLIWNSGVIQRSSTVATIGGEKVTGAEVSYYYYRNLNSVVYYSQMYGQLGMEYPYNTALSARDQAVEEDDLYLLTNTGVTADEQDVGKSFHDLFLENALTALQQERALCAAAAQAGMTLSEEGKAAVEDSMASLDQQREDYLSEYGTRLSRNQILNLMYGSLMNEDLYRTCLENSQLAAEYYGSVFDAVSLYSAEELDAYYQANADDLDTYNYYYRYFAATLATTTNEDGETVTPTEEEQAQARVDTKAEAEKVMAEVAAKPASAEDMEFLPNGGEVGSVLDKTFAEWLTAPERAAGDTELFELEEGFFVLLFDSRERVDTPTVNVRHILVSAMAEDDLFTEDVNESTLEPTAEAYAAAKAEAEALIEQWKAGEATEASFAALAEEHSADAGSSANGGLYENVAPGDMIPTFDEWIFDSARQPGDTGVVQNTLSSTKGWHAMYFVGTEAPVWQITAAELMWVDGLDETMPIVAEDNLSSLIN